MLTSPVRFGLRLFVRSDCTSSQVSLSTMASWVFLKIFHSSFGRSIFVLSLNERVVERKLTVCPQYSSLSRISATVLAAHLCGIAGKAEVFLPCDCQYSVGVGIPSENRMFAICVGPYPSTHKRNIFAQPQRLLHQQAIHQD